MTAYDQDFYAWTKEQAALIRLPEVPEFDRENVAEEIDSVGKLYERQLFTRTSCLIRNLLIVKYADMEDARQIACMVADIQFERLEVISFIEESPSLKNSLESDLEKNYRQASIMAAMRSVIDLEDFPRKCPFSLEQILDKNFFAE